MPLLSSDRGRKQGNGGTPHWDSSPSRLPFSAVGVDTRWLFSSRFQESLLSQLSSNTPLAFKLVCNGTTLSTVRDAVRMVAELTPEQRETYYWRNGTR